VLYGRWRTWCSWPAHQKVDRRENSTYDP
jgi:hypothetical protein